MARVVSSVVERLVYTEDVGGSKPSPPTSRLNSSCVLQKLAGFKLGKRVKARTARSPNHCCASPKLSSQKSIIMSNRTR